MKIVFVGPSLGSKIRDVQNKFQEMRFESPAARGDVLRAVERGAKTIGLIDGYFGDKASVWHKEILYALSCGVHVIGGASMGALRAAECTSFGMRGVGEVFRQYADGRLMDDEAVALVHGPAELDYMPLSVPRVDFEATFNRLASLGLLTPTERAKILMTVDFMHYAERTYRSILDACNFLTDDRKNALAADIKRHKVELKGRDAMEVIAAVSATMAGMAKPSWTFAATGQWESLRREIAQ